MVITTEEVRALREKTGVGMMDCKKALTEAKGNSDKAVEILRKKGMASAEKRAGKTAAQGIVDSYIHLGGKIGVLIEVNCESDFVAKNIEFQGFAKDVAMQIAASSPQYITREEVPKSVIKHEKEILETQAKESGKPAKAMEKIVQGRLEKFYSEICLMDQPYIKDPKLTIKDILASLVAKIGENLVIRRFSRFQLGEKST